MKNMHLDGMPLRKHLLNVILVRSQIIMELILRQEQCLAVRNILMDIQFTSRHMDTGIL